MEQLKEFSQVLLTVFICVGQVDETESSYEYLQTLLDSPLLKICVEEELLKDPDSRQTEVSVA